jgi:hypothetical protein
MDEQLIDASAEHDNSSSENPTDEVEAGENLLSNGWMAGLITELRRTGSAEDQERASIIEMILKSRGQDIPLPQESSQQTKTAGEVGGIAVDGVDIMTLKDSGNELITRSVEDDIAHTEKAAELSFLAEKLVRPYCHLFDQYIPAVNTNTRNILRKIEIGKERHSIHEYRTTEGDLMLNYHYDLTYIQGEEKNTLKSVAIALQSQHDPVPERSLSQEDQSPRQPDSPKLYIDFHEGQIQQARIAWLKTPPYAVLKLLKGQPMEKFISEHMVLDEEACMWGSNIQFVLVGNSPELYFGQSGSPYYGLRIGRFGSTFRLGSDGRMQRFTGNIDAYKKANVSMEDSISQEQYLELLKNTLSLVPVITSEDIRATN